MQRLLPSFFVLAWLVATPAAIAQVAKPRPLKLTMRLVMTPRELQESGVASLSPSQRKALDDWLNRYTQRVLKLALTPGADSDQPHKHAGNHAADDDCRPAIQSQIDGDFNGWDGDTLFKLTNGEIWEQDEYDLEFEYDYMPDVTIYPAHMGCRMKVEGMDDTILVKRIK